MLSTNKAGEQTLLVTWNVGGTLVYSHSELITCLFPKSFPHAYMYTDCLAFLEFLTLIGNIFFLPCIIIIIIIKRLTLL